MENRDIAARRKTFARKTNPLFYVTLALTLLTAPVSMQGLDYMVSRVAERDAKEFSEPVRRKERVQIPYRTLPIPTGKPVRQTPEQKKKDKPKQRVPEYPGRNPDNMPVKGAGPSVASYESRLRDMLARHEGKRNLAYNDSRGIRTVGIGFNLEREGAEEDIQRVGANYSAVYNKIASLSDEQISRLLEEDMTKARADARKYCGEKVYDNLPENVRLAMDDLSFNLGYTKLSKFKQLRKYLEKGDFYNAANAMVVSKWYNQVGVRGKELVEMVRNEGRERLIVAERGS